jgi:hypothetical protein
MSWVTDAAEWMIEDYIKRPEEWGWLGESIDDAIQITIAYARVWEQHGRRESQELYIHLWIELLAWKLGCHKLQQKDDEVPAIVAEVLATNPKVVQDVRDGKEKAKGFLLGQVLKRIKADRMLVQKEIDKQLTS